MATTLNARQVASLLGRNQGPEPYFQQSWSTLGQVVIPKQVNLNRPLERFHTVWTGRITLTLTGGGAAFTPQNPEGLQSLIQRFRLTGTHKNYGAQVPIDLTGADVFAFPHLFKSRGASMYITNVTATGQPTLVDPLGCPAGLPGATFGTIPGGGTQAYDVEIHYDMSLLPILPAAAKLNALPFLYMQSDWGDTLQLQLFFGDATSLGTANAGVAVAFSAFGSNSGSPLVQIFTNYEILGALSQSIASAVIVRANQTIPSGNISAQANSVRLIVLKKYKTTNIIVKTGIAATGTSPGVSVFASLSDFILDFTQVVVDNKPIRNNQFNRAQKEYAGYAFDSHLPQGYLNFPFDDSMNPLTAYPGDMVSAGANFEIDSNVLTSTSNQAGEIIQEYYVGSPQASAS